MTTPEQDSKLWRHSLITLEASFTNAMLTAKATGHYLFFGFFSFSFSSKSLIRWGVGGDFGGGGHLASVFKTFFSSSLKLRLLLTKSNI